MHGRSPAALSIRVAPAVPKRSTPCNPVTTVTACRQPAALYLTWISDLLAPDGTFIHPRAAERTKFCSAYNRPAPEAVTSAHADVEPTGAAAFRAFLRHRSTLVPFLRQPSLHSAARQPAGTGSAQILRSISPKSRRFR